MADFGPEIESTSGSHVLKIRTQSPKASAVKRRARGSGGSERKSEALEMPVDAGRSISQLRRSVADAGRSGCPTEFNYIFPDSITG